MTHLQTLDHDGLSQLYAGDKAVLALVHPVNNVHKNYLVSTKLRQESITLANDASLNRPRFEVIEQMYKDYSRIRIVANPESVKVWLQFLLRNHQEFMQMERDCELKLSDLPHCSRSPTQEK